MISQSTGTITPRVRFIPVRTPMVEQGMELPKTRIAVYARVSTLEEEQQTSYQLQISYFQEYIARKPDWELYKVYSDEGITGTNTKYRKGFNQMMEDAKAGKFDMIITKSISRFARNTLDCLTYVRMLKELENPVGVLFDKEGISTLDSRSETILTILASIMEEESRTISANVQWGVTKRFSQGIPHIPTTYFLGYDEDEEGKLIINEEEAKTIKRIYKELLEGRGTSLIAQGLARDGIETARGNTHWTSHAIQIGRASCRERVYGLV